MPVEHDGALLLVVSQTRPQPLQLVVDVVGDSQPLALLPEVSQSANPATTNP